MSPASSGAQVGDVVLGAEQAGLLGPPPGEADRVGRLDLLHLDRGLEERRAARAVVVDPGAVLDAVEVRAGHDDVVVVALPRLGEHVPGLTLVGDVVDGHRHRRARGGRKVHAGVVGGEHGRDGQPGGVTDHVEQPGAAGLPLVHDDHSTGTCGLGVEHLDVEPTGAPLHQRHSAGGEAGEVSGLAAARVVRRRDARIEHQAHRPQRARRGALGAARVERVAQEVGAVHELPRLRAHANQLGVLLEVVEGELLDLGVIAGVAELLRDVVDGRPVAGLSCGTIAVVVIGYLLERLQVVEHTINSDGLRQLLDGVVVRVSVRRQCGQRPDEHNRGDRRGERRDASCHEVETLPLDPVPGCEHGLERARRYRLIRGGV